MSKESEQIVNVLLNESGPSDQFVLRFGWFKFKLKIKPLTTRQLIRIGGELSKVKEIDQTGTMFPSFIEHHSDIHFIAKVVAIATGSRFQKLVTKSISDLPLKDLHTLFLIVIKQCDLNRFFFLLNSVKEIPNLLKTETD